jgi:CubicO group peptidase (beta-lactamase class C family)
MSKPRSLLTVAITVLLAMSTLVHAADDLVVSRFGDYLEALRRQAGIPGMVAAIVDQNGVTWERPFGYQDVDRIIAARLNTPFELDGVTEAIAASLVLRCAANGLLSLDDRVGKFVPSSPDAGATLAELLSHTSGAPGAPNFSYRPERLAPIAAAIAACTETTYRSAVAAFLDQLAMVDSVPASDIVGLTAPAEGFTAPTLQRYADVLSRLATPYTVDARGRATPSASVRAPLTPAAGLISTVRDLEQFDLALKNGIVPADWLARAWTPPIDATGRPLPHGYGWFVQAYNGERVVWQFGVNDNGTSSLLLSIPRRGLTLILLANSPGLARPFPLSAGDVTVSPFARLFLSIFLR